MSRLHSASMTRFWLMCCSILVLLHAACSPAPSSPTSPVQSVAKATQAPTQSKPTCDTPLGLEVQRLLHSYPCRRFLALTNELRRYAAYTVCLWRVPSPQLRGGPQIPHDTSAGC